MAARESVQFDFLSKGAGGLARDFEKTGESASLAAKGARLLADALEKQRRASDVSAGASLALAKADKILDDAEHVLADGALEAEFALKRQAEQAKKTAVETAAAGEAAGSAGGGFSAMASPMGALVGAGIALAPVLATVGIGLAGEAIAAKGVIDPLVKAASSAKGLQGAWAKLDPEQRAAAESLLTLKGDYAGFQNALKPEILTGFADATRLAGHVLHDIQPVAIGTGKALNGFLVQFGQTLQDPQWQQFWSFMAKTAPQDVRLLGNLFLSLAGDLPPLLEDLQPLAVALLKDADAAAKVVGIGGQVVGVITSLGDHSAETDSKIQQLGQTLNRDLGPSTHRSAASFNGLADALNQVLTYFGVGFIPKAPHINSALHQIASNAHGAGRETETVAQSITDVNNAISKSLSPLLAYSGALITTRDDAKTFAEAMKKSHGEISLNTAAQRNSFSAANTYIQDLVTTAAKAHDTGRGVGAEITMLQNALPALERAKTHSRLYWQEVQMLVGWLHKLQAEKPVREKIFVTGTGQWSQATTPGTGGGPRGPNAEAGMFVRGGTPGRDSVLVNTMPGELIVPTPMVQAGAVDHLRGRIPGFAQGGIVPSYAGPPPGLRPWGNANLAATDSSILNSIGNAMAKGFMQSFAGLGGLGAGASGPLQSIARQMLGQLGWGSQWPQFNALEMREAGWKVDATNPSSGAYGLPQALPPGKMASAGADWRTNPVTQLRWMMGYIGGRYGSPAGAWAHEVSAGWYDRGGYLPPGLSIAMNGTGRPEPVGAAMGSTYNITVNVPVSASPRETGRAIVAAIKKFEQGSGSGWRK